SDSFHCRSCGRWFDTPAARIQHVLLSDRCGGEEAAHCYYSESRSDAYHSGLLRHLQMGGDIGGSGDGSDQGSEGSDSYAESEGVEIQDHGDQDPCWECSQCSRTLTSPQGLVMHEETHGLHRAWGPHDVYHCRCGKQFNTPADRMQHVLLSDRCGWEEMFNHYYEQSRRHSHNSGHEDRDVEEDLRYLDEESDDFVDDATNMLLSYGVKPWDDDAGPLLDELYRRDMI
ncbi:hypothetical protein KIPB_008315, partial [Kipferlia bialata]